MKHWLIIFASSLVVLGAVWIVRVEEVKAPAVSDTELQHTPGATATSDEEMASTTPPDRDSVTSSILPYNSGIKGKVLLGPTCPIEKTPPDPNCADRPYATAVTVYRTGSAEVYAARDSNETGEFDFSMPPGSYTVTAAGGKTLPTCSSVEVTVEPDIYASILISCDTGIR